MKQIPDNFAIFIISYKRSDNVATYELLKRYKYSGKVFILIDDDDPTAELYIARFGDIVIKIDKETEASKIDDFDNFGRHAVLHARNACFDIAERMGIETFLQLDDDYTSLYYRFPIELEGGAIKFGGPIAEKTFNEVICATIKLFNATGAASVAYSQGGDWISGAATFSKRKCMNSFFCSTKRRFAFVGRANEDVNTYTLQGGRGLLFLTIPHFQVNQRQTQKHSGGTTDVYLDEGTYVKSFYTILCAPSCARISTMGGATRSADPKMDKTKSVRLHHRINWACAVPCILDEKYKK